MQARALRLLRLSSMAPPRRSSDNVEADHRPERQVHGPFNGHTKWVVGVVSAGIVSALTFLVVADRQSIDRRITALEQLTMQLARNQDSQVAESRARWEEVQRSLQRIEAAVENGRRK